MRHQSDDALVTEALAKAGARHSNAVVGRAIRVSEEQVRRWRQALAAGEPVRKLTREMRDKLRAYLGGTGPYASDAEFWRRTLEEVQRETAQISDRLAAILTTHKPID